MPYFRLVGALALLAAFALAPATARAADLVVWWIKPYYPEEERALREMVAAFEKDRGKQVELVFYSVGDPQEAVRAVVERNRPLDFVFGTVILDYAPIWAADDRLADLTEAVGWYARLFDADAIERSTLYNRRTGRRALYGLPIGRSSIHVHAWTSLLSQVGFKLEDIPKEWEPFWAFWCDKVQPAVRKALGRDDIWALGLPMSAVPDSDTHVTAEEFMAAYGTSWVPPENRFVPDDPERRARLIRALDAYTALYKKGCTPPDSLDWDDLGNNKAFLDQRVVATVNQTLSIPNALLTAGRADDYYKNTWTVAWPNGPSGEPLPLRAPVWNAVVPKEAPHLDAALDFVRFLVAEQGLVDYLVAAHQRFLPPMRKLLEQPFWLNSSDPHEMLSAIQVLTHPTMPWIVSNADRWRSARVEAEGVWDRAVHRVAADGLTPEQAVDEALARMAEIWDLPAPE